MTSSRVPMIFCFVLIISLVAPLVAGQVFDRGPEGASPGTEVLYRFDPRMDADWKQTGEAFQDVLGLVDPWPVHTPRNIYAERLDDELHLSLSIWDASIQWMAPIAVKGSPESGLGSTYGVAPEHLPVAVVMEYASHHSGRAVRSGNPASVSVFGPPGTFSSFGTGADGVRDIAVAMGVPVGAGSDIAFETTTQRLPAEDWEDWIGRPNPTQGSLLYRNSLGKIVLHCDCTRVTFHASLVGTTLNRVVGFYDLSGEVLMVHATPWADLEAMGLLPPEDLEAHASLYVNESSGRPVTSAEFTTYDLYLPRVGDLTLAAYVDVHTPRIDGVKKSWRDVAIDPADGRLINFRMTTSSSGYLPMPGFLTVVAGVSLALGIGHGRRPFK